MGFCEQYVANKKAHGWLDALEEDAFSSVILSSASGS